MGRAPACCLLLLLAGCGGGNGDDRAPAARTAPAAPEANPQIPDDRVSSGATAVGAGSLSSGLDIEARKLRLVRVSDGELALQFELVNGTESHAAPSQWGIEQITGRNLLLADLARGSVYGVLPLSGSKRRIGPPDRIAPGATSTLTAVFSAPPAETTEMLVMIPSLDPTFVAVQPLGADALVDSPVLSGPVPPAPLVAPIVCGTAAPRATAGEPTPVEFRLPGDVLFAFGRADLSPSADAAIDAVADEIGKTPGKLTIEGHTDSIDDAALNQKLSEQRAAAVADALRTRLGDRFTYETRGFGKSRPIAPNQRPDGSDDPDGRAQNRRVEIRLGTMKPAEPVELESRDLGTQLADLGLTARVAGLERRAGYVLARTIVSNPTSDAVNVPTDSGLLTGKQAPEGLTLVDTAHQRRHRLCQWREVSPTIFHAGNQATYYESRPNRLPPGADVTFWALYAAPPAQVTQLDVEIGGFDQVVPSPVTAGRTATLARGSDAPAGEGMLRIARLSTPRPAGGDELASAFDRTENAYFRVALEKANGIDMRANVMPAAVIAELERQGKAVRPSRTNANVGYWAFLSTGDFVTAEIVNNPRLANLGYAELEELFASAPRDGTKWQKGEALTIGKREFSVGRLDADDPGTGGKRGEVEIAVLEGGKKAYYYYGRLIEKGPG
jgi:outer membrane protein OmpA-like peptidoglycan-associated protein